MSGTATTSAWQDLSHVKKVGVIGGGVSGIQMARSLAAAGIECKVFDKAPSPGGLWRENYSGYGLQVMKQVRFSMTLLHTTYKAWRACQDSWRLHKFRVPKFLSVFWRRSGSKAHLTLTHEITL
jgi:cation diffusion facilitator CzcD-associated flavoprotein CzcO